MSLPPRRPGRAPVSPLLTGSAKKVTVLENGYRDLTDEELQAYYPDDKARAFCKRKYVSEFAWEMDRSTKEILKNWEGK